MVYGQGKEYNRNLAISRVLVKGARDVLLLGYEDASRQLLEEALSFSPADSDANYLAALLDYKDGKAPYIIKDRLEKALINRNFQFYTLNDAKSLYASILAKSGSAKEALRQLTDLPNTPEKFYTEALARLALADFTAAEKLAKESVKLFPWDGRAIVAFFSYADTKYYEKLAPVAFDALPALREHYPELLVLLADYANSEEETRWLLREYRAMGYSSPLATELSLKYGLVTEKRAVEELFASRYIPTRKALERVYQLLSSDESRQYFTESFRGYSGYLFDALGPDGRPALISLYDNGKLVSWLMDTFADGKPDRELLFSSSLPDTFVHHSALSSLKLKFGNWPYIEKAVFYEENSYREYFFAPNKLYYRPVVFVSLDHSSEGPFVIEAADAFLSEKMAAMNAYRVQEGKTNDRTEIVLLDDGMPLSSIWKKNSGSSGLSFYNDEAIKIDYIDNDGDGRHESRRFWAISSDNRLAEQYTELDEDGDGIYEYRETAGELKIKSWDYDADGLMDMILAEYPDGKKSYRFFYDNAKIIEAIFYKDKLLEVSENGISMPLFEDLNRNIVWIGEPVAGFAGFNPGTRYGIYNGMAYRLFFIDGTCYAQLVD
ncbi:hypothetical protein MASR2M29_13370 [Spirochaetota bacterium]